MTFIEALPARSRPPSPKLRRAGTARRRGVSGVRRTASGGRGAIGSLINGSTDNASTGTGDMAATDSFTATVSAIVVAVNPTGTLSIKGDRHVRVNGEDDTIHLSGVVRPQDLDSNNMISSSEVADLEVSMLGQGQVRDKQGNGVGTRLFDWLWAL